MSDETTNPSAENDAPAEESAPATGHRRRGVVVGSTTLACAVGGALLGAAAFSAGPGSVARPGAANDSLTTSSTKMPGVVGSLCSSTRQTATAADTALSCTSFGVSSYTARLARELQMQRVLARQTARAAGHPARTVVHSTTTKAPSAPTATPPAAPSSPSTSSSGSTSSSSCHSVSAPSGLPDLGSVSVSASGGGGSVSASGSSTGGKLCATAPKLPKAPTLPSIPTSTTLPSIPGVTGSSSSGSSSTSSSSTGLSGVVNTVTGDTGL